MKKMFLYPEKKTSRLLISISCFIVLTLACFNNQAQTNDIIKLGKVEERVSRYTPNGIFDTVTDRFGNKYTLQDISISKATEKDEKNNPKSEMLCSPAGYFNLYFEQNSGMEGTSAANVARRDVICQLFNDLSNFISSPLTPASNTPKVSIWIRSINQIPGIPSGVLAMASSFYCLPGGAPSVSGVADNEMWKTINSGTDSYENTYPPVTGQGGINSASGGAFFHGMMTFDFSNYNWHTDLTTSTAAGYYDLYSIALHEILHSLGFTSLINANGLSKLSPNYNYYSRYDLNLQTQTSQPLITNTGNCSLYSYSFNSLLDPLTVLAPNPPAPCTSGMAPDNTVCSDAVIYAGTVNQPVFTPYCFMPASSLSHLEDQCHLPNNYSNNMYYVMSNANGTGSTYMKRYLKPEERQVLCDIGYKVNSEYGSVSNLNYYNYGGSQCPGVNVVGVNDGITAAGAYAYVLNTSSNITISDIQNNDYTSTGVTPTFECLELILGGGTVNILSNTSFTYSSGSNPGIAVLRYIPVLNGERGNITYVIINIQSTNCNSSVCDMINNGGFENGSSCGQYGSDQQTVTECWAPYSMSPEIQSTTCTNGWIIPSPYSTPPSGTWNNASDNNNFINLSAVKGGNFEAFEAMQNQLSSPMIPGQYYRLSFYAKVANVGAYVNNLATTIEFAGSEHVLPWLYSIYYSFLPPACTHFTSVLVPNNNAWNYFTLDFQCDPLASQPFNNLVVLNAFFLNPSSYPSNYHSMVYIDDVSLTPLNDAITFNIPTSRICSNQTISDLNLYTNPSIPGGTFSGDGITCNAGICSFDPSVAGAGDHFITYTYTNAGCSRKASFLFTVISSNISASLIQSDCSSSCSGSATVNINSGTPPYTYTWSDPSVQTTQTATNLCAGNYSVSVTDGDNCVATDNITINDVGPTVSNISTATCSGGTFAVTPVDGTNGTVPAGTTYSWGIPSYTGSITGGASGSNASYLSGTLTNSGNTAGTAIYTVTPTSGTCTGATFTITVTVNPKPVINQITSAICSGRTFAVSPVNGSNGIVPSGTTYSWGIPTYAGNISGGTAGTNSVYISGSLTNSGNTVGTATYTVTPTYGTCSGPAFTITITVNPLVVSAQITNMCGEKDPNGSIDLTLSNCATTPITYTWSNGSATQDIVNLSAGTYTVTITDANNITHVYSYTVQQFPVPEMPDLGHYVSAVCGSGSTYQYTITNPETNVVYTWSLSPANAGTIAELPGNSVNITWNTISQATITIHCQNTVTGCAKDYSYPVFAACNITGIGYQHLCNISSSASVLPGFADNGIYISKTYIINGYFLINNNNMTFSGCTFIMGPLANIQIANGITTTFGQCSFSSGCNYMWDGIYAEASNSLVVMNRSQMKDAINGLVSKNGGQYTLAGNTLYNNYYCMQVKDYNPPTGLINVTMRKCTFQGIASLPYPPYTGSSTSTGILIQNIGSPNTTNGIMIGNTASYINKNTFTNLYYSIYADRSNIQVYNNKFINTINTQYYPSAIIIKGSNSAPVFQNPIKYSCTVGGSEANYSNTFNSFYNGIYADKSLDLTIVKDTFSNCKYAIWFSHMGDNVAPCNTSVNISNNYITTGIYNGIRATMNPNCTAVLGCNTISMAVNNSSTGISITGSSNSNDHEIYSLNANSITSLNGIFALDAYRINANSNNITQQDATSLAYGMRFVNCNYQYISNSYITGTSTRTNKTGISIENTQHPVYNCNSIYYVDKAFNIVGTNTNTPALPVSILSNNFGNCNYGMVKSNGGIIGQQGNATTPWRNRWINVNIHTYGSGVTDDCYARTSPASENFTASATFNKLPGTSSAFGICPSGIVCPGTVISPLNTKQVIPGETDIPNEFSLSDPACTVQQKIIENSFILDEVQSFMAKQIVYAQMATNKNAYMQDAKFDSFIKQCESSSIGILYNADKYIGLYMADSAEMYNTKITTTNPADSLHQYVNSHFISYLRNGKLTATATKQMRDIARLCPFEYGDGVYIARALLSIADTTSFNYTNICETKIPETNNLADMGTTISGDNIQLVVYPNPAKDLLTIEYESTDNNSEDILFMIFDIMGKKLIESNVKANQNGSVNIASLTQGVYIYKFIYKNKVIKNDKLVIIK